MSKDSGSSDNEAEYVVEKILNHRKFKGKKQYRVRWEGYDTEEETWENESNCDCPGLIAAYEKSVEEKESEEKDKPSTSRASKTGSPQKRSAPVVVAASPSGSDTSSTNPWLDAKAGSPAKRTRTSGRISASPVKSDRVSPRLANALSPGYIDRSVSSTPDITVKRPESKTPLSARKNQVEVKSSKYRVVTETPTKVLGFKLDESGELQALLLFSTPKPKHKKSEVELTPMSEVKKSQDGVDLLFDYMSAACKKTLAAMGGSA